MDDPPRIHQLQLLPRGPLGLRAPHRVRPRAGADRPPHPLGRQEAGRGRAHHRHRLRGGTAAQLAQRGPLAPGRGAQHHDHGRDQLARHPHDRRPAAGGHRRAVPCLGEHRVRAHGGDPRRVDQSAAGQHRLPRALARLPARERQALSPRRADEPALRPAQRGAHHLRPQRHPHRHQLGPAVRRAGRLGRSRRARGGDGDRRELPDPRPRLPGAGLQRLRRGRLQQRLHPRPFAAWSPTPIAA